MNNNPKTSTNNKANEINKKIEYINEIHSRIKKISEYNYEYHIKLFQELLESQNADKVFSELKQIPIDSLKILKGTDIEFLKKNGIRSLYELKEHEFELVDILGFSDQKADKITSSLFNEEKRILSEIRKEIQCSLSTLGRDILEKSSVYSRLDKLQDDFSEDFSSYESELQEISFILSSYQKSIKLNKATYMKPLFDRANKIITADFIKKLEKYENDVNEIIRKAINDVWDYYLTNDKSYNDQYKSLI